MRLKKLAPLFLSGAMFLSYAPSVLANSSNDYINYNEDISAIFETTGTESFIYDGNTYYHEARIFTNVIGELFAGSYVSAPDVWQTIATTITVVNENLEVVGISSNAIISHPKETASFYVSNNLEAGFYYSYGMTTIIDRGAINFYTSATNWWYHNPGGYSIEHQPVNDSRNLFSISLQEAMETDGMIKALNSDGISGYIYAREIVEDITNEVRFINLYDEDGITVIGEFKIG